MNPGSFRMGNDLFRNFPLGRGRRPNSSASVCRGPRGWGVRHRRRTGLPDRRKTPARLHARVGARGGRIVAMIGRHAQHIATGAAAELAEPASKRSNRRVHGHVVPVAVQRIKSTRLAKMSPRRLCIARSTRLYRDRRWCWRAGRDAAAGEKSLSADGDDGRPHPSGSRGASGRTA